MLHVPSKEKIPHCVINITHEFQFEFRNLSRHWVLGKATNDNSALRFDWRWREIGQFIKLIGTRTSMRDP